jgi:hypothetical protein
VELGLETARGRAGREWKDMIALIEELKGFIGPWEVTHHWDYYWDLHGRWEVHIRVKEDGRGWGWCQLVLIHVLIRGCPVTEDVSLLVEVSTPRLLRNG